MILLLRRHSGFGNSLIQLSALHADGSLSRTILIGYDDIISSSYLDSPFKPLASLKAHRLYVRLLYFVLRRLLPKTSNPLISLTPKQLVDFFGQDTSSHDLTPLSQLSISRSTTTRLKRYLGAHGYDLSKTLIIHARGGDYRSWPSAESPALLPSSYYNNARNQFPNIDCVLVLTNDPDYLSSLDFDFEYQTISLSHDETFCVLALARYIVLSPSTYGYAAFYVNSLMFKSYAVAPIYWAGWPKGEWFPPAFQSKDLQYIPVF